MSTGTVRGSMALVATLAALVIWPAGATATATADWGWAVVRRPAESSYGITAPKDRASSSSGAVTYVRDDVGISTVTFVGIGGAGPGGNVQVSALSSRPRICVANGWDNEGTDLTVQIRCFDRAGQLRDVPYVVSFTEVHTTDVKFAYAWANDEDAAVPYQPADAWTHVPDVGAAWASRSGTGTYTMRFTGLGAPGGHVQVTAYGWKAVVCRTVRWFVDDPDLKVRVTCRKKDGSPVNARYSVAYMRKVGLKADAGARWAYLLADRPTAASYTPALDYRKADPAGKPTVRRTSRGVYEVVLPSMPLGGAAHVTPYGTASARCNVSSIRRTGTPQRIGVRCWKADGSVPADALFALSYVK